MLSHNFVLYLMITNVLVVGLFFILRVTQRQWLKNTLHVVSVPIVIGSFIVIDMQMLLSRTEMVVFWSSTIASVMFAAIMAYVYSGGQLETKKSQLTYLHGYIAGWILVLAGIMLPDVNVLGMGLGAVVFGTLIFDKLLLEFGTATSTNKFIRIILYEPLFSIFIIGFLIRMVCGVLGFPLGRLIA